MSKKYIDKTKLTKEDWLQVQAFQLVYKIQRQRQVEPLDALVMAVLETNDIRFKELKVSKKAEIKALDNWRRGERPESKKRQPSGLPRGISWSQKYGKYLAQICYNGKVKFVGYFRDLTEATEAYEKARRLLVPAPELLPE